MDNQINLMDGAEIASARNSHVQNRALIPNVLLAEDNSINAELTAIMANKLGVTLAHAANGNEAVEMVDLAAAKGKPFALVLMDVVMPLLDGVGATRKIRAAGHSSQALPIVAVTAAATRQEIDNYIAAGMQACLSKPVSKRELSLAFDMWLHPTTLMTPQVDRQASPSLQARYKLRKVETIARIDTAIAAQDSRAETIAEICNLLHKLAGTAGSFGEAALSMAAIQCVNALTSASADNMYQILQDSRKRLSQVS